MINNVKRHIAQLQNIRDKQTDLLKLSITNEERMQLSQHKAILAIQIQEAIKAIRKPL